MQDFINWLIQVEEMAADLYSGASVLFGSDKKFSEFLFNLAADEEYHARILKDCAVYLQDYKEGQFIKFDSATREKIEIPFSEKYDMLLAGTLTRESLIDSIIEAEFSELNHVFLYVISCLKPYIRNLSDVRAAINDHVTSIEKYLGSLSDSAHHIEKIKGLSAASKNRILIVENFKPLAELLEAVLGKEAEIEVVTNDSEALAKISSRNFNAVISDIRLPVTDAMKFYKDVITANPTMRGRILLLSESTLNKYTDFINENSLQYLQRPAKLQDIVNTVREMMCRNN